MSWKKIIRENDLVKKLSLDKQKQFIDAVKIITLPKDKVIFQEGEESDGCYFIFSGEVEIYTTSSVGQPITLARLDSGLYFGEQACLTPPFLRNASARTISKVSLGFVAKEIFLQILEEHPVIIKQLSIMGAKQLLHKVKAKSIFFANLSPAVFNITANQIVEYHQNETIFREGDQADAVYFILDGEVILKSTKKRDEKIIHLNSGNLFGELGVVKSQVRKMSAFGSSPLVKLIKFEAEAFIEEFQRSKQLQQWLKSLQAIYEIPQHGIITQSISEISGRPCITTLVTLANNKKIVVNKLIDLEIISISLKELPQKKIIRYENKKAALLRELSISNNQIVAIDAKGYWENLPEVCEIMFSGKPLLPVELEIFAKLGDLHIYPTPRFFESNDIVCNCMKVSFQEINDLIQQKVLDLETICQKTGAGMVCGSCRPKIAQMLGRPFWMPVRIAEVITHTPQIKSFRFKKLKEETFNFKPGQHIIVQCAIQGKTVERSYTLTNSISQQDYYEITIKKQNEGLFSRWIFNPDNQQKLFKISSPQGNFKIDFDQVPQAVFFAGGIGITPAISFVLSLIESKTNAHLLIDYSFQKLEDGAFHDLLEKITRKYPEYLSYQYRITDQDGLLQESQVEQILQQDPQRHFYICGPAGFQKMIHATLRRNSIPEERIHIEVFVHATRIPQKKGKDYPQDALGCPLKYRGTLMALPEAIPTKKVTHFEEAHQFLYDFYESINLPEIFSHRWQSVKDEYKKHKTYWQTSDELTYGSRMAWKNSTRCIGRDQWNTLIVRDLRHLEHEDDVFHALLDHIKLATNGGNLVPLISIFAPEKPDRPGVRIWNHQLIRYAGYKNSNGTILGDPSECDITLQAESLGWTKKKKSAFDVLPLLIQMPNRPCQYYEIPKEFILEVPIVHPTIKEVASLNLKWYAVPMVSNMCLAIGGIRYPGAPFNGWYMGTEIGARNFGDVYRYNILPKLAEKMGLDTSTERSLWQDYAIIVLNAAVLYSFEEAGVKMVDHHTASRNFLSYGYHELASGHEFNANWSWIVPPISGSATGVFHQGYRNLQRFPNFLYQKSPWEEGS